MRDIKIKKITIYAVVFLLYTMGIVALCRSVGMDSDKANHLLQAKDILSGNIFFKDWNLTGITFLTTDLLFYEIAELFFGVSYRAVYVAAGLMISSVIIVSFFISVIGVRDRKQRIVRSILAVLLLGFPCRSLITSFRVHTGAIFFYLCMFVVYYLYTESEKEHRNYLVYMGILAFLGTFGDLLMFIQGVIPVLILGVLRLLREEKNYKKNLLTVIVPLVCVIAAILCEKLYFAIGGANPNSYIGNKTFTPVNEWGGRIRSFIVTVMNFSFADFSVNRLFDISGALKGVSFFIVAVEIVLVITVLVKLIKGSPCDSLSELLALSCLMAFLAYVLTNMSRPKYITIVSVAGPLLLIRNIQYLLQSFYRKKAAVVLLIIMASTGFVGKIHEVSLNPYPESNKKIYELIDFLESRGLTGGYASFWNASNLTVLSNEKIKVRHIRKYNQNYRIYNWFNKNSWYKEPVNFILINTEGNIDGKGMFISAAENTGNDTGDSESFGMNEKNVVDFFGEPSKRYKVREYIILVYEYDLSKILGVDINSVLPLGHEYGFSTSDFEAVKYLKEGFSRTEKWGTWTVGNNALMRCVIENPGKDLVLRFECLVYNEPQNITLKANDIEVYSFNKGGIHSVLIPKGCIGEDGLLSLSFYMPDAVSPAELGKSSDARKLGVGLKKIQIVEKE